MIGKYIALVFLGLLLIGVPIFVRWAIRSEKRDFNNGICPRCGETLEHFDTDSQGGRGYTCPKCKKYYTWVSYPSVDREYRKRAEKEYYNDGLGDRYGRPFND